MTRNQMADMIWKHSVEHKLNGQKNTKSNIRYWFKRMFTNGKRNVLFTMEFPDGEWMCMAIHDRSFGYDYIVPDNREQEYNLLRFSMKF